MTNKKHEHTLKNTINANKQYKHTPPYKHTNALTEPKNDAHESNTKLRITRESIKLNFTENEKDYQNLGFGNEWTEAHMRS